jgi:2-amino-4-hydroxy-6-hydroxymethyldihydropteridine diphosphokinase
VKPDEQTRRLIRVFFLVNLLQGYLWMINGTASKYIRAEFGLSEATLAFAFGLFALGSLGTLWLSRQADRYGRRRLTLLACGAAPVLALGSALAPGIISYVLVQILVVGLLGLLFAVSVVVITEELPDDQRAGAQAWVGLASGLGSALVLLVIVAVLQLPGGWRWLWAPIIPTIVLLPRLRRFMPETGHFERAEGLGETESSRLRELLQPRYRRRVAGILGSAFLGNASNVAAMTWGMYHLLENVSMSQAQASGIFAVGGVLAVLGFPMGGRWCDAWGRRGTATAGSIISTVFAVAFFQVPLASPWLFGLLALTFGVNGLFRTANMIAWRISATELFPTRLRAAVQGLAAVSAAVAAVLAQFATGVMAEPLGGLINAASVVTLLGIPAGIVFWWLVPETAGVRLEDAALEDETALVHVGLGSNLGDRFAHLDRALEALEATLGIVLVKNSARYETDPVGGPPGQGPYLNAVVALRTTLGPRAVLERLLAIEAVEGRKRDGVRDGPREIDLDLLLYDERVIDEPDLTVPHPRLHERAFVLEPLRDVAPDLVHPVLGETIETLAVRVREPVRPFVR